MGSAGTTIGSDGSVYALLSDGRLVALTRDLKPRDSFSLEKAATGASPMVFQWKGRDVVAAGTSRLYLLDPVGNAHTVPRL